MISLLLIVVGLLIAIFVSPVLGFLLIGFGLGLLVGAGGIHI